MCCKTETIGESIIIYLFMDWWMTFVEVGWKGTMRYIEAYISPTAIKINNLLYIYIYLQFNLEYKNVRTKYSSKNSRTKYWSLPLSFSLSYSICLLVPILDLSVPTSSDEFGRLVRMPQHIDAHSIVCFPFFIQFRCLPVPYVTSSVRITRYQVAVFRKKIISETNILLKIYSEDWGLY